MPRCRIVAKAVSISFGVLALRTNNCRPRARGLLHVAYRARCFWKLRIHQEGEHSHFGYDLIQKPQCLAADQRTEPTDPGDISARPVKVSDEAFMDRVAASREHDRNCSGC